MMQRASGINDIEKKYLKSLTLAQDERWQQIQDEADGISIVEEDAGKVHTAPVSVQTPTFYVPAAAVIRTQAKN